VILASWFGGVKYPKNIPAGLVAIFVGTVIAWGSDLFGLQHRRHESGEPRRSVQQYRLLAAGPRHRPCVLRLRIHRHHSGHRDPFGVYDLVEAMDNVESAEAAGDHYPTTRVLTADGVVSLIGALMGNPFINAVYIGHPGWKAMGGRIGYSAATGAMVIVLAWMGVISLLLNLVPVVAILPILLYIGMLVGAQAFQATPASHAPAIVLALTPHLAAWGKTLVDGALTAAGTSAAAVGMDKLGATGVLYHGLEILGEGSILSGLVLAAMAVFVIERDFVKASAFAAAGAVLTFFGFMHGPAVGIAVTPGVALAYALVAAGFFAYARSGAAAPMPKTAAVPAE
jgi:AGZA family xanthine/uracil permease-like MFS transporter